MKSQVPIDQLLVWAFRDGAPPDFGDPTRTMFKSSVFDCIVIRLLRFPLQVVSKIVDFYPNSLKLRRISRKVEIQISVIKTVLSFEVFKRGSSKVKVSDRLYGMKGLVP